jgi:hypothetical protein
MKNRLFLNDGSDVISKTIFFIYNLNQQSEFAFYKLML